MANNRGAMRGFTSKRRRNVKANIYERDGGRCWVCGDPHYTRWLQRQGPPRATARDDARSNGGTRLRRTFPHSPIG